MKVLIIHGWGADSSSNWFPWLKNELEAGGIAALCPDLPNTNYPKKEEWIKAIRKVVPRFDKRENIILVGHSLGAPTILRLLETFGEGEWVRAVILVSGFASDIGIEEVKNFVDGEFDFDKIKKSAKEFVVINSDNDPYVPLDEGKTLAKALGAEFIVEKGAGHINLGDGYFRYDRVLGIIRSIS